MGLDASEVVVGANGTIYVCDADTAASNLPDDVTTAIDSSFTEVGYVSEDGVTFTVGQDVEDIGAWQSFYPVRKVVTGKNVAVEFVMRQWNRENVMFGFGGGDVDDSTGVAIYTPAEPGELDDRAIVVEWEDGADIFRLVFPRGLVTGEVSTNVVRTAAADLPIHYEITPEGLAESGDLSTQPWYLVSNALGS